MDDPIGTSVRVSVRAAYTGLAILSPSSCLTSEAALVDFKINRSDKPDVGRYTVSGAERHYIAGYKLVCQCCNGLAIPSACLARLSA